MWIQVFALIFFYFSVYLIADEMVDEGLNNAPRLSSFFTFISKHEVQALSVKPDMVLLIKKGVHA